MCWSSVSPHPLVSERLNFSNLPLPEVTATAASQPPSVPKAPGRPSHARCSRRGKSRAVRAGTDDLGRLPLNFLPQRRTVQTCQTSCSLLNPRTFLPASSSADPTAGEPRMAPIVPTADRPASAPPHTATGTPPRPLAFWRNPCRRSFFSRSPRFISVRGYSHCLISLGSTCTQPTPIHSLACHRSAPFWWSPTPQEERSPVVWHQEADYSSRCFRATDAAHALTAARPRHPPRPRPRPHSRRLSPNSRRAGQG